MCREIRREQVKDDIENSVRVEVKVPDETNDAFPYRLDALRDDGKWFQRETGGRGMWSR